MTKLQSEPAFKLLVTDAQFRAVGHVALQWSFLENEIDREIDWLNEDADKPVKPGAKFEDRAQGWARMATLAYEHHPQLVKEVEAISAKAVLIKGERDKLVHGTLSASGTFFRNRRGNLIEVSDLGTAPHIEDLACRISEIMAALDKHQGELIRVMQAPL